MSTTNPIPLSSIPRHHESSYLRSPRDSDTTSRQWIRNRVVATQTRSFGENIRMLQQQIDSLRRRNLVSEAEANPFLIYRTSDWLTYRVSDGLVIGTGEPITVTNVDTDIVIDIDVEKYWFYIEMTETTAEIKTSATTLTWSSSLIPIGWVDTLSDSYNEKSTITQFLRDNVFNPCL